MIKHNPELKKFYHGIKQCYVRPYCVDWKEVEEHLKQKESKIKTLIAHNYHQDAELKIKRSRNCRKTNQYEWGELQPGNLMHRNWVGSTAERYAVKRRANLSRALMHLRKV